MKAYTEAFIGTTTAKLKFIRVIFLMMNGHANQICFSLLGIFSDVKGTKKRKQRRLMRSGGVSYKSIIKFKTMAETTIATVQQKINERTDYALKTAISKAVEKNDLDDFSNITGHNNISQLAFSVFEFNEYFKNNNGHITLEGFEKFFKKVVFEKFRDETRKKQTNIILDNYAKFVDWCEKNPDYADALNFQKN